MHTNSTMVETHRLHLRPHVLADFESVAALWAEPSVVEFIMPAPLSRSESWTRLLRYVGHWAILPYGYWVVEDKASGEFLGEIGFADWKREITPSIEGLPELGWIVKPAAQGHGIASEAVQAALTWAEHHIAAKQTVALIDPNHTASISLARKVGFGSPEIADFDGTGIYLFRRVLTPSA